MNEVLEKVIIICKDVFDNEQLDLSASSCAADVEGWDSLTHLSLISDLEEEFQITFTLDEISNANNLGDLVLAIKKHKGEV